MQCLNEVINLFDGPTRCGATCLALAAFVVGAVFALLAAKLCCPCKCGKKTKSSRRQAQKEERPFEKRKPHPAITRTSKGAGHMSGSLFLWHATLCP